MISPEKFRRQLEFDIDMAALVIKYSEFFDEDIVIAAQHDKEEKEPMLEVLRKAMSSGANIFVI